MLLAARDSMLADSAPPLPYDAEIEYLGSDSVNAWIDTGIVINPTSGVEVTMAFTPNASDFDGVANGTTYGASRTVLAKVGRRIINVFLPFIWKVYNDQTTHVKLEAGFEVVNNAVVTKTLTFAASDTWTINTPHTILAKLDDGGDTTLAVDGVEVASEAAATNPPSDLTYVLGQSAYCSDAGALMSFNNTTATPCRIYAARIWDDGDLVRDFKAVRVGAVGYMFDSVSQTLFGTAGSGDFTLGPDL